MKKASLLFLVILSYIVLLSGCGGQRNTTTRERGQTIIHEHDNGITASMNKEVSLHDTLSEQNLAYFLQVYSELDTLSGIQRRYERLNFRDSVKVGKTYELYTVSMHDSPTLKLIEFEFRDGDSVHMHEEMTFAYRPFIPEELSFISFTKSGRKEKIKDITIDEALARLEEFKKHLSLKLNNLKA